MVSGIRLQVVVLDEPVDGTRSSHADGGCLSVKSAATNYRVARRFRAKQFAPGKPGNRQNPPDSCTHGPFDILLVGDPALPAG